MKKQVAFNVLFNFVMAMVFVYLDMWALSSGFEETFVAVGIGYGILTIIGNAIFVNWS